MISHMVGHAGAPCPGVITEVSYSEGGGGISHTSLMRIFLKTHGSVYVVVGPSWCGPGLCDKPGQLEAAERLRLLKEVQQPQPLEEAEQKEKEAAQKKHMVDRVYQATR